MNSQAEIDRLKEYYAELKETIDDALSEAKTQKMSHFLSLPDVSDEAKKTIRLCKEVVAPFINALAYVVNNRLMIENVETVIQEHINSPKLLTGDEIYDVLETLNPYTVVDFISTIRETSNCTEDLIKAFANDDKNAFVRILRENACDTRIISCLCQACWQNFDSGFFAQGDDALYLIDAECHNPKHTDDGLDEGIQTSNGNVLDCLEALSETDLDDEAFDEQFELSIKALHQNAFDVFCYYARFYFASYGDFRPKEKRLIDAILNNPLGEELLDQFKAQVEHEKELKALETKDFALPDDYFMLPTVAFGSDEFFYLKAKIRQKGVAVFTAFINYLAESGFIENNKATKELLAFRLTGRIRPKGALPKILWHGRNDKPYELIYIVKHFCDRGDYKKMRDFFEGPEWVKNHDSSYAIGADSEFRRYLSELYPEVCVFKK